MLKGYCSEEAEQVKLNRDNASQSWISDLCWQHLSKTVHVTIQGSPALQNSKWFELTIYTTGGLFSNRMPSYQEMEDLENWGEL